MAEPLYFGCWGYRAGHFLHTEHGSRIYSHPALGFSLDGSEHHIDAQLAPRLLDAQYGGGICYSAMGPGSHVTHVRMRSSECQQGQFLRHVLSNGYTILQWWDRCQGDDRGGCNSSVLLDGIHSTETMLEVFRLKFPAVSKNLLGGGVELVEVFCG